MIRSIFRSRVSLSRVLPRLSYCSEPIQDDPSKIKSQRNDTITITGILSYFYNNPNFYSLGIRDLLDDKETPDNKTINIFANKNFSSSHLIESFRLEDHVNVTCLLVNNKDQNRPANIYLRRIELIKTENDLELEKLHRNEVRIVGEVREVYERQNVTVLIVSTSKPKRDGTLSRMAHRIVVNNDLLPVGVDELKGATVKLSGVLSNDNMKKDVRNLYFVFANKLELV